MTGVKEKAQAALPTSGPISERVAGLLARPAIAPRALEADEVAALIEAVEEPLGD